MQSLVAKMDVRRIWACSADADVIALSEICLSKSVTDRDISFSCYNAFRTDRPKRDGGGSFLC